MASSWMYCRQYTESLLGFIYHIYCSQEVIVGTELMGAHMDFVGMRDILREFTALF